jgi:hypothetical protein
MMKPLVVSHDKLSVLDFGEDLDEIMTVPTNP